MVGPALRHFFFTLGILFVLLGGIGIFLPLVPTTPFLILAAYCFSRSSKKFHDWLLGLPKFGPLIRDWEEAGVISKRAKTMACLLIIMMLSIPIAFYSFKVVFKIAAAVVGLLVISFILSRPSIRKNLS